MATDTDALTTERIRFAWANASTEARVDDALAEFDTWLNAHDARVRAAALEDAAKVADNADKRWLSLGHNFGSQWLSSPDAIARDIRNTK